MEMIDLTFVFQSLKGRCYGNADVKRTVTTPHLVEIWCL